MVESNIPVGISAGFLPPFGMSRSLNKILDVFIHATDVDVMTKCEIDEVIAPSGKQCSSFSAITLLDFVVFRFLAAIIGRVRHLRLSERRGLWPTLNCNPGCQIR